MITRLAVAMAPIVALLAFWLGQVLAAAMFSH